MRVFLKKTVPNQQSRATDQQTVRNVEIRPGVLFVLEEDPVAHRIVVPLIHVGVVPEPQTVVKIAANATHHTRQRNRKEPIVSGAKPEQPNQDGYGGEDGKNGKPSTVTLPSAEKRALVSCRLNSDVPLPDPPLVVGPQRQTTTPLEHPVFGKQIGGAADYRNGKKGDVAVPGNRQTVGVFSCLRACLRT